MPRETNELYEFDNFRLNVGEHELERLDGLENGHLHEKAFQTLCILVRNKGHLVSKQELIEAVWPNTFVEENNLEKCIFTIRKFLCENGGDPRSIETVRKHGYRFVADTRIPSQNGQIATVKLNGQKPTREVRAESTNVPNKVRLWRLAIPFALLFLTIGGFAAYRILTGTREEVRSIAVLPLTNETGSSDFDYLCDGISEHLINKLSPLTDTRVIARASSFSFKGKNIGAAEAATALGVESALAGRVTRQGDDLVISVEMLSAADNRHIWGDVYTRKASDLLGLQSDLGESIARSLRLHLNTADRRQLAKRETLVPGAFELFLRGQFYAKKGGTENYKRSIDYFEQAIALDPSYALAHAELSAGYQGMINVNLADPKEFAAKAEEAAARAVQLDDELAEAHLAMSEVKTNSWKWAEAENEIHRALELNPHLVKAHSKYFYFLVIQGRYSEAIDEARLAHELDPLSPAANQAVVYGMMLNGQNDLAIESAMKMLELDPNNPSFYSLIGQIQSEFGHYQEAIAAFQESIKLGDTSPDIYQALSTLYAKSGDRDKAKVILQDLENGTQYVSPVPLAMMYAALGEREKAFELLYKAFSEHDQQLIWLGIARHNEFADLRDDQRFEDLIQRVGVGYSDY